MKSLVLSVIFVCVLMKIDAFPQQNPAQASEIAPNTVPNLPKVESVKVVDDKAGVESAVHRSSVPSDEPTSSEPNEAASIVSDASKQNNGDISSVNPKPKAENSNGDSTKTSSEPKPESDKSGEATAAAGPESSVDHEKEDDGDGESSEEDKDNGANGSGSLGYMKIKDLIQRIQERIHTLIQHLQMRNRFGNEKQNGISGEDSEADEARNINFPSFSIDGIDELQ